MKLFTQEQTKKLLSNGSSENRGKDHHPVVKLFLPGTDCTWLLTEIDPEDENIAFGLCDLGQGYPELGYVDLQEIINLKFPFKVERDRYFEPNFPISVFARAARKEQAITESSILLRQSLTP